MTLLDVKQRDMKKLDVRCSFIGFLERYHPERGYIVNKSCSDEALMGQTQVRCLPYWELMFEEVFLNHQ